jgi:chitin synthase
MADNGSPYPAASRGEGYGDPFADRPRQTQFSEPEGRFNSTTSLPRPFESTTTLQQDFGSHNNYDDDEYVEKQPLTSGQNFSGGFYPPGSVDPNAFGDPYAPGGRPGSILSTSTNGVDSAWRRRQTIKRGVTRKVKLTNGNFITEYPVPTPVYTAIESKWSSTKTNEFS